MYYKINSITSIVGKTQSKLPELHVEQSVVNELLIEERKLRTAYVSPASSTLSLYSTCDI